jgi:hypothetical protein
MSDGFGPLNTVAEDHYRVSAGRRGRKCDGRRTILRVGNNRDLAG